MLASVSRLPEWFTSLPAGKAAAEEERKEVELQRAAAIAAIAAKEKTLTKALQPIDARVKAAEAKATAARQALNQALRDHRDATAERLGLLHQHDRAIEASKNFLRHSAERQRLDQLHADIETAIREMGSKQSILERTYYRAGAPFQVAVGNEQRCRERIQALFVARQQIEQLAILPTDEWGAAIQRLWESIPDVDPRDPAHFDDPQLARTILSQP